LYPGRIDLGIGRAPGSDGITAAALAYGNQIGIEYFPTKIGDLMAFLTDDPPPTEAFSRVAATPRSAGVPELWMLGSSDQSALLAAHFGLGFSYAQFITEQYKSSALKAYRDGFKPSAHLAAPTVSVCIFVVCADTEEEADRLALSRDYWNIMRERNRRGPFPSVEEALAQEYSDIDRAIIAESRKRLVWGSPDQCKERLIAMASDYDAEEVVVLTITHDAAARRRSYELLAEAFGLARRDAAA
jgi:luciferase family oxidoreductase group 1